jgi:hypothetical protein
MNPVASPQAPNATITLAAEPTALQSRAIELLGVPPLRVQ